MPVFDYKSEGSVKDGVYLYNNLVTGHDSDDSYGCSRGFLLVYLKIYVWVIKFQCTSFLAKLNLNPELILMAYLHDKMRN